MGEVSSSAIISGEERLAAAWRYVGEHLPADVLPWAAENRPDLHAARVAAEDRLDEDVSRASVESWAQTLGAIYDAWRARDEPPSVISLMREGPAASGEPARVAELTETGRHRLITDSAGLEQVIRALAESTAPLGADVETTGLDARRHRVRLLSLSTGVDTWVIDCYHANPAPLWPLLADRRLLFHNGLFDLQFLAERGFAPGWVDDTLLLSQLVYAGENQSNSLAACVLRELDLELPKDLQTADWGGPLTREMVEYAARDAAVLPRLYETLREKAELYELKRAAAIERRCLPAVVWMAGAGVGLDTDGWRGLLNQAAGEAEVLQTRLNTLAPRTGVLALGYGWNWDSPEDCARALAAAGFPVESTGDDVLAALDCPLAETLREYRGAQKRVSGYGEGWLARALGGRLYPEWNQLRSRAGRMSSASPNVQQIPREDRYRACIVAAPGRVLVKADYATLELRIAAFIAGETAMIDAFQAGEDLHTRTAVRVFGAASPTKADRQKAKSANFGLLYGMGAEGLRIYAKSTFGVAFTPEEAATYRRAFFQAYPALRRWHEETRRRKTLVTRTLCGRRRALRREDPDTFRLNTPVQGTGADGLKRALALLWERRAACPGAVPVIACHDELVVECGAAQADAAREWLERAMLDGMAPLIAPVPVEVESRAGKTWAG